MVKMVIFELLIITRPNFFFPLKGNRNCRSECENGPNRSSGAKVWPNKCQIWVPKRFFDNISINMRHTNMVTYVIFVEKVKTNILKKKLLKLGQVGPKLWRNKCQIWVPKRFFDNISINMRHTNMVMYIIFVDKVKSNILEKKIIEIGQVGPKL